MNIDPYNEIMVYIPGFYKDINKQKFKSHNQNPDNRFNFTLM